MEIAPIILDLEAITGTANSGASISFTVLSDSPATMEISALSGPSVFFEKVAQTITHPFCILLPKNARVDFAEADIVLQAMRAHCADMAIVQVQDVEGQRSILPRRLEDLRFSSLLPVGAVIFTREHFVQVVQKLSMQIWDAWWHFDLVRLGVATGFVYLADRVVTKTNQQVSFPGHGECLVPLLRPISSVPPKEEPIILVYGAMEASVSLYFEGLPPELQRQVRFYSPCDPLSDLPHLAMADAVIIVRDFEHMATNGLLEILEAMEVPLFWFTDDQLESLRPEYPAFRYYDSAAMKAFLSRVRGVLVSTPSLAEAYRKIHNTVILWPPVFDETLAAPISPETDIPLFKIGVFGGSFRRDSLLQDVMPAIRQLQNGAALRLYLRSDLARGIGVAESVPMPFDSSYRQFVFRWQRLGLHAVIHPFGHTRNIDNKSLGSILTARYLGAVPIVAAESEHRKLGEEQGVLVAEKGEGSWKDALQRVLDKDARHQLFGALDSWCRDKFSPENTRESWDHLVRMIPSYSINVEQRLSRALSHPRSKEILFPSGAPVQIRRPSFWERIGKWSGGK